MIRRFEIAERELAPDCLDIQVIGELDLAVSSRLDEALENAVAAYLRVLIDLERCTFIDSSGIAVILRAHTRMTEQGRKLAVYAPADQVLRVLSMTGLTANGLVFENAEEALTALDQPDTELAGD
jgi:anti-sigma B factor antagonist